MALQVGHQDDRCSVPSGHRGHALRTRERLPPGPERRRPSEATAGRARVDGEGTVPAQPVAVPQVSIARDRWDDRSRWLTRRLPDGPRQPQAVSPLPTPNPSQPSRFCIISTYTVTYGGTPLCISGTPGTPAPLAQHPQLLAPCRIPCGATRRTSPAGRQLPDATPPGSTPRSIPGSPRPPSKAFSVPGTPLTPLPAYGQPCGTTCVGIRRLRRKISPLSRANARWCR